MSGAALTLCLVIVIFVITTFVISVNKIDDKQVSYFVNKSENGYYYDTEGLKFVSVKDRKLAIELLIRRLKEKSIKVSESDIDSVSDSMILSILESEDGNDETRLIAKLILVIDPRYKDGLRFSIKGSKVGKLTNDDERIVLYQLLSKYANLINRPLKTQLNQLSDVQLVTIFRSLNIPKDL